MTDLLLISLWFTTIFCSLGLINQWVSSESGHPGLGAIVALGWAVIAVVGA
jgi:hypothetical protein